MISSLASSHPRHGASPWQSRRNGSNRHRRDPRRSGRLRRHPDPRGTGFPGSLAPPLRARPAATAAGPARAPGRLRCWRPAGFPRRHAGDPRVRLDRGTDPGRTAGPSRRDHRPGRAQDDHQRAELRREGVHGRLRGFLGAHLRQSARRPDQPARHGQRHDRVHLARWQELPRQRQAGRAGGAPTRLASARQVLQRGRRADRRRAGRLRPVRVPQRPCAAQPPAWPVFLSAETGSDGGSRAVGRR